MEEFLKELREILTLNNYGDVDEIIEYFKELILDSIENGQSEKEVIETLGSVKEIAYSIIDDKKIKINEDTSNVINMETISADINIDTYEGNEISVECNSDKFEVKNDNGSIYIKEIKRRFEFSISKKVDIFIHIPNDYKLNKINLSGISSDVELNGDFFVDELKIKTVSGDIKINKLECGILNITSVSGDVLVNDAKVNDANVVTVSGDIDNASIKCNTYYGKTVSGDVEFKGEVDTLKLNTKSGDINACINGLQEDYHVECKESADKKISDKSLLLNSISGDINYCFKG